MSPTSLRTPVAPLQDNPTALWSSFIRPNIKFWIMPQIIQNCAVTINRSNSMSSANAIVLQYSSIAHSCRITSTRTFCITWRFPVVLHVQTWASLCHPMWPYFPLAKDLEWSLIDCCHGESFQPLQKFRFSTYISHLFCPKWSSFLPENNSI